jgi:hypothetical protein
MSGDRAPGDTGREIVISQAPSAAGPQAGSHAVMEANPDGIVNRIARTLSPFPEGRADREAGE